MLFMNLCFSEIDVSRLKRLSNLETVNFKDNPLNEETHAELLALNNSITVSLTSQDPDFDAVD